MSSPKKRFGEMLVEAGLLKEGDLSRVLQEQRGKRGERIGETVVRLGLASEVQIARALSDQLGIPFIDLTAMAVSAVALQEVPSGWRRSTRFCPWPCSRRSSTSPWRIP
jgi:type IV pilus assembly protein PilB